MRFSLLLWASLFIQAAAFASVELPQFQKMRAALVDLYTLEVEGKGARFEIVLTDKDKIPQALSRKTSEGVWQIEVYQSMLDLKSQSIQTLGMMLCHEVGHFLGGEPYVIGRQLTPAVRQRAPKQMSCEGEADYFSTSVCFRKLAKLVAELKLEKAFEGELNNECYLSFSTNGDREICLSGLKIARDLAIVYQDILTVMGFPTTFQNRFDPSVSDRTLNYVGEYPTLECRYQTLVHGLLCAEKENGECLDPRWMRPLCWFSH